MTKSARQGDRLDLAKLADELVRDECRHGTPELKVYPDSKGIPTIGVGHNLNKGISKAVAYQIMHEDIDEAVAGLTDHLPWWVQLDEVRQRVLVNMVFNMGIDRFLSFRRMIAALMGRNFQLAADEMQDSDWFHEVGARAVRLISMMRQGS
jgi:lysozyme